MQQDTEAVLEDPSQLGFSLLFPPISSHCLHLSFTTLITLFTERVFILLCLYLCFFLDRLPIYPSIYLMTF